jgi:hypothetical protein
VRASEAQLRGGRGRGQEERGRGRGGSERWSGCGGRAGAGDWAGAQLACGGTGWVGGAGFTGGPDPVRMHAALACVRLGPPTRADACRATAPADSAESLFRVSLPNLFSESTRTPHTGPRPPTPTPARPPDAASLPCGRGGAASELGGGGGGGAR